MGNNSTISMETMSSTSSSHYFCALQNILGKDSLHSTWNDMGFIQTIEFTLFSACKNFISKFSNTLCCKPSCVGFSNFRNNLLLLSLIVKNWNLHTFWIFELSSWYGVASNNCANFCDAISQNFSDVRSCNKHSSIWYLFISF